MEVQISEQQIFESLRHLLDHQQSIIHAALIATGVLLAAAAWCATHDKLRWVPLVAVVAIAVQACLLMPAIQSCQLYETTLEYGAESRLELLDQYAGATGGWSPVVAVIILGGVWVLLLLGMGVARLLRALSEWLSLEYPRPT